MGIKNSRDLDLLTLGQLFLRLSPPNNERLSRSDAFVERIGGVELNVTVSVALLGPHTGAISELSVHGIGNSMKGKVRSFGASDDPLMYDQSSSVRMGIYYYKSGAYPRKPKVIYNRSNSSFFSLNIDEIPEEVHTASKCSHTTGIALVLNEEIHETTIEMIRRSKAAGTLVSFNMSFKGNLWTEDEARECIPCVLPYVDIFSYSEDTAGLTFLKTETAKEMMKSFSQEFPVSIVASTQRIVRSPKRHTFGSVIYDAAKDEYYKEEPYRDIEVVDRIGSGDAYISGALYELLSSGGDCSKTIAYGNATAVVKNITPGDLPSSDLEEIETIIKAHGQTGPRSEMARQEIVAKL